MNKITENWQLIIIAALLGTSGGAGIQSIIGIHDHPDIIREIREVQYDNEIYKLTVALEAMEDSGQGESPSYKVAEAQLVKFSEMRAALNK